jgi:hypothetical protein
MSLPNDKSIGSFEDVYEFMGKIRDKIVDDKLKKKINYILDSLSEEEFNISRLNGYFMFIKKVIGPINHFSNKKVLISIFRNLIWSLF